MPARIKNWSISNKVFALITFTVVLSVTSISTWIIYKHQDIALRQFDDQAKTISTNISDSLELPVLVGNDKDIKAIIDRALKNRNLAEVKVFDAKGGLISAKRSIEHVLYPQPLSQNIISDFSSPEESWYDDPALLSTPKSSTLIGRVEMTFSADHLHEQTQQMISYAILSSIAIIMFSSVLGFVIANMITKPLKNLATIANKAEKGDLNQKIEVDSHDETGQLAHAFDAMLTSLDSATENLVRTNLKLKQSNDDLDQFAYVVSHDLGAPLRRIIDFSRILKRTQQERFDEKGLELVERIGTSADNGMEMMEGLLELSRIKTREKPFQAIDLTQTVRSIVDEMDYQIRELNAEVQVNDLPTIDADPIQIRQLFQNLISNALKYHRDDTPPIVQVSSELQDDEEVKLTVKDNGIGFEPEQAQHIFMVFKRLHNSGSKYKGSGVGLAICQRIVQRMNGSISAHSTPGEGSEFLIYLPMRQQSEDIQHA